MSATKETILQFLDKDIDTLKNRLLSILAKQSYKEGKFVLASGKESNYYIDGKQTTLHAEGSTIISIIFLKMLKESIEAVGGMSVGADPLASGVSQIGFLLDKNLHAFYVRKEPKKHGTSKWIEGPLEPGMKVVILEDVVTTGGSSIKAIEKVQEFGCSVKQVLAIVDRKQGGAEAFKKKGIEYNYIFDINQIAEKYKSDNG